MMFFFQNTWKKHLPCELEMLFSEVEPKPLTYMARQVRTLDVTSLFPFINKTDKIPLGRPQIVTENFDLLQNYADSLKYASFPQSIYSC